MALKAFDDLYDFILPYLPGAEKAIVDLHIRRVLREFFKRTTVWREVFEFDSVGDGTDTYQLQPSVGEVALVMGVSIDDRSVTAIPEDQRRHNPPTPAAKASRWYTRLPHLLTLYPAPYSIQPVRVEAAITIPVDGTLREFPEDVYMEHAESIAAGVIASMMSMPGKPWTQKETAKDYGRTFASAIRTARGMLRDGGQPNQSTFTGPRFGA